MESKKLVCRHCQGDHLTIQCPSKYPKKEVKEIKEVNEETKEKQVRINYKNKKLVLFKNLPLDISKNELIELLDEWRPIGKVFLKNTFESVEATVEFEEEQAKKVIYQLNDTPFEHYLIKVEELTTKNYH
jgi:hypothetical protein